VISDETLLAAGFRQHRPSHIDRCDDLFQMRVRDENGTRYFINVRKWIFSERVSYDAQITFNDGCTFHPSSAALQVLVYGIPEWSVADVVAWADQMWTRLTPNYYERDR
jgi:hypothetical protein